MHLRQRGNNLQYRNANSFLLPMWFVVSLSNLCLPCTLTYPCWKEAAGKEGRCCRRHLRTTTTEQKYLQRRQESPESPFYHASNYGEEGKKRKE